MPREFKPTTAAFNPEITRQQMWARLRPKPELLDRAVQVLEQHLTAKKTQFFSFQGQVIEKRDVEDHQTQQAAVDKILSWAGAYTREKDQAKPEIGVAIEVDPRSGVVRLVVGSNDPPALGLGAYEANDIQPHKTEPEQLSLPEGEGVSDDLETQVIKVRRTRGLPANVYDALFGEDDQCRAS